jgi:hypothetical protein
VGGVPKDPTRYDILARVLPNGSVHYDSVLPE